MSDPGFQPPPLDGIVGHDDAKARLRLAIRRDALSHAYVITGPRGVGRRTLATAMAMALNCESSAELRPCGACRQCRRIARGVHPDVRTIKRSPERRMILLKEPSASPARDYYDYVDWVQGDAQRRPVEGRSKVYLLLGAEELLPDAANRLLKSIEEPTASVHFILTAGDRGAVLPTIASRCQELRLRPVERAVIAAALQERFGADPERARGLAALARGAPGWAFTALREPGMVETHQTDVLDLVRLLETSRVERLLYGRGLAERWTAHPETVRATLRAWLTWARDLVLWTSGAGERAAHCSGPAAVALERLAPAVGEGAAIALLRRISAALADLEANVNARLVLDLLVLRFPEPRAARVA
ncbi:MAG: DNA polymerase III subunit [Chloroflexi bacterium]|nr:DNA polymerase III subunit [Chloroflexota bacterium]